MTNNPTVPTTIANAKKPNPLSAPISTRPCGIGTRSASRVGRADGSDARGQIRRQRANDRPNFEGHRGQKFARHIGCELQQRGRVIEQEVKMTKPRIDGADSDQNPDPAAEPASDTVETQTASVPQAEIEQLDDEEKEFRALRRDLPGVKGTSAAGIVAISVGKAPAKNEFFRTHKEFRAIVSIVDLEVGMERQFFAVTADMVEALRGVGITVTDHVLYLTITTGGAYRIVPVRQANADGEQNEYHRTKEIGLVQAVDEWVRLFTDQENRCYKVFPAPAGRFADPTWPDLKPARIFKLAFRDKGRLLDSIEHPLFKKWVARDAE